MLLYCTRYACGRTEERDRRDGALARGYCDRDARLEEWHREAARVHMRDAERVSN